jgi:hypothetical protein
MQIQWLREELIQLLSLSGTLAGLSITAVTLLHSVGNASVVATIADDILAVTSLMFLVCCYLIFFSLRTQSKTTAIRLEKITNALFLFGLSGMVSSAFIMVYTLW